MDSRKVNILGTAYEILRKKYDEYPDFKERDANGFCDGRLKQIIIGDLQSFPEIGKEPREYTEICEKELLRHEIIHAFLDESGLRENTLITGMPWSRNDEMIDWIALQFPKILKVYKEAGAL